MDNTKDILVETNDPIGLDKIITTLPTAACVVGGPNGPFRQVEGCYVVRAFTNPDFIKFALENQGYAKVIRVLDELV